MKVTRNAALIMVFGLSACGGGGGGGSSPASTSVSGTAAKGIVKQASVLVCRIVNGAPQADASCAATVTGIDGSFSVTFSDGFTGPAMVKVMPAVAATMMDEISGTDIPYNMTMRAVVPVVSANTMVPVTPFSEMAASAASKSSMDAASINQAIATVQTIMTGLGIKLNVMPVVDLRNNGADTTALGMQLNMVKQLARIAMAARNSGLLTDSNGVPCNTAGTTVPQQFSCAVTAMAGIMTGNASSDAAKTLIMLTALNAQNVTNMKMPIRKPDGTMDMEMADITSLASMTAAMQNAGMMGNAQGTVQSMMGGMH